MLFGMDKKAILNLRLRPEVRDEFAIAAELRGASMSGLLHQFIVRTIREEKEQSPQSFVKSEHAVNGKIVGRIEPGHRSASQKEMSKEEIRREFEQGQRVAGQPRFPKSEVKPVPDDKVDLLRRIAKLTNETSQQKQKSNRKKAGGKR